MDERPIGVFDSGLGGLSALAELERLMPGETLYYFGDSSRMPYGGRSDEEITALTGQVIRFLCDRDVKLLLVACGTISSIAMPRLAAHCPVPYTDVLGPAAEAAAAATKSGRIGIWATEGTVRSRAYERALHAIEPALRLTVIPAPKLAPLVEAGHLRADDPALSAAVAEYAVPLRAAGVDTLLLGCTHYPLVANAISAAVGGDVELISNGAEAARALSMTLRERSLAAAPGAVGGSRFFTTGDKKCFADTASQMLTRDVTNAVVHVPISALTGAKN